MLVNVFKGSPETSDECYKMAYTDAISVAAKALGIGADVYWAAGRTKYSQDEKKEPVYCTRCKQKLKDEIKTSKRTFTAQEYFDKFGGLCPDCVQRTTRQERTRVRANDGNLWYIQRHQVSDGREHGAFLFGATPRKKPPAGDIDGNHAGRLARHWRLRQRRNGKSVLWMPMITSGVLCTKIAEQLQDSKLSISKEEVYRKHIPPCGEI